LPARYRAAKDAEQDCLSAIAFALEGNPADFDPSAEALALDVRVAPPAPRMRSMRPSFCWPYQEIAS
jgi:hypothetical protein